MDDFTLCGPEDVVDRDIAVVASTGTSLGSYLNVATCELVHPEGSGVNSAVMGFLKSIAPYEATLLGPRCCQAKAWTERWICAAPITSKAISRLSHI